MLSDAVVKEESCPSASLLKDANKLFLEGRYKEAIERYTWARQIYSPLSKFIDFNISRARQRMQEAAANSSAHTGNIQVVREPCRSCCIFVGIASIPQREAVLRNTLDSLLDQVDHIGVFLDKYESPPSYLAEYGGRVSYVLSRDIDRDLGDAGKFYWVDHHDGYYFTCDDDLVYPNDYISRTIACIEHYKTPVVVGWHGSVILTPFDNYYDKGSRRVFAFGAPRPHDTPVHILGTGCLGFHTRDLKVRLRDFDSPNMADIYFAVLGQSQQVPFIVIQHDKGEISESENSQAVSIYKHSSTDEVESRQNTKKRQIEIVSKTAWTVNYPNRRLKIAVVGRFFINSKGGVYKSSRLLVDKLAALGHDVAQICLSDKDELSRLSSDAYLDRDFFIFYAPDPERPDFGDIIQHVVAIADKGCVCAVNFSVNLKKERSAWIVEKVKELNRRYPSPRIFVAAFSNATRLIDDFNAIGDHIVVLPKTMDPGTLVVRSYEEREGVFLGDLAKLINDKLVFDRAISWIEQIRIQLPHVNIYALKHYHTDKVLTNYINIIPYSKDDLGEILSRFRLYVCLTPGATFEMIPVEAAMSGTPVIHRAMPQSLSEYLSPIGVEIGSPAELGKICRLVYERRDLWERLSSASIALREVLHVDNAIAAIEVGIRKCLIRAEYSSPNRAVR